MASELAVTLYDCNAVAENEDILVNVEHGVGLVTLNRPSAINSLNHAMATGLAQALHAWEHDDAVHTVLLTGAGERGLCAGGDVVAIYHSAKGDGAEARSFWHDEYVLNAHIADYSKPYVAIMDGIVMGGGVGVAAHGSVRVVTDTTKMGMPEVGIGFIPDVGGTYLLSRTPGLLGVHAALTGAPFSGADAIAMGFADHFVPHDDLAAFTRAIVADGVDAALSAHAVRPPASPLLAQRHWIDECYTGATVLDVLAALRGHERAGHAAADQIAGRPPSPWQSRTRRSDGPGPGNVERRSAPRIPDVVRVAAVPRPGGGHSRATRRQGPQPAVVTGLPGIV